MAKQKDSALWREIGRTAKIMAGVVAVYTIAVALASPEQLLGWFNTLLSTVLSVFSALVIGLALFHLPNNEPKHPPPAPPRDRGGDTQRPVRG